MSPHTRGGNGSACVVLMFPVEADLPAFVYLPSISCGPCNSAAAAGTSGGAWTSGPWQGGCWATRASDTALRSSGSCRGGICRENPAPFCSFPHCPGPLFISHKETASNEWTRVKMLFIPVQGILMASCTLRQEGWVGWSWWLCSGLDELWLSSWGNASFYYANSELC